MFDKGKVEIYGPICTKNRLEFCKGKKSMEKVQGIAFPR
jgi:hypothetical protein